MAQAAVQTIEFVSAPRAVDPLERARCIVAAAFYAGFDLEQGEAILVVSEAASLIAQACVPDRRCTKLFDHALDAAATIGRAPQTARAEIIGALMDRLCDVLEA